MLFSFQFEDYKLVCIWLFVSILKSFTFCIGSHFSKSICQSERSGICDCTAHLIALWLITALNLCWNIPATFFFPWRASCCDLNQNYHYWEIIYFTSYMFDWLIYQSYVLLFLFIYGWFAVASLKKNNDYSHCFYHLSIFTLVLQVHFCLKKWWIHAVLKESVPSLMLQKDVLVSLKGKRMLVLQFGGEWVETILSIFFVLILLSELLFLFWMAHAIR